MPSDQTRRVSSSRREGFRLEHDHNADCAYVTHPVNGDHPYTPDTDNMHAWNLNKRGGRRGAWTWYRFRCNDTRCPATVLVRIDVLAELVSSGVEDRVARARKVERL